MRTKLGLALSGGGALGVAHVGVLEELDRHELRPQVVCGTSAGAIIGLLFCEGGLEAISAFLDAYDRLRITSKIRGLVTKPPRRLFAELRALMSPHIHSGNLADIVPRFICVATDVATGEPVALEEGDPLDCVLASAAYPGVFPMQKVHGALLIDGGVSMNLPADIARRSGADFVVGSSLYSLSRPPRFDDRTPLSRLQTMIRSIEIMERALSSLQMTYCDFCFVPSTGPYKWYDFDHIRQITEFGRQHARARIGELVRLLEEREKAEWPSGNPGNEPHATP